MALNEIKSRGQNFIFLYITTFDLNGNRLPYLFLVEPNKIKLLIRIKLRAETEDKTVPREFHELKQ